MAEQRVDFFTEDERAILEAFRPRLARLEEALEEIAREVLKATDPNCAATEPGGGDGELATGSDSDQRQSQ